MTGNQSNSWQVYEKAAWQFFLDNPHRFGLNRIERNVKLKGTKTGTIWNVDLVGYMETDGGLVVIECKRRGGRIKQIEMAGLAFVIQDVGAVNGMYVTTIGVQRGAALVANTLGIGIVNLNRQATPDMYGVAVPRGGKTDYFEKTGCTVGVKAEIIADVVRGGATA